MSELNCLIILTLVFATVVGFHSEDIGCGLCNCRNENSKFIASCHGEKVVSVPENLPSNVTDIHLTKTAIEVLTAGSFKNYSALTAIKIRDATSLHRIEPGTFDGLVSLKILSIYGCFNLKKIERGVLGQFNKLDTLLIVRSGLESVPDFRNFSIGGAQNNRALYEIDLTANKITAIRSYAFRGVKTAVLRMQHSKITTIEKNAFYKAQIVKLLLSLNDQLTTAEEGAFENILDLSTLDLSSTKIKSLPAGGLANIKELILENTPSLKTFPSILSFYKLERAVLYYPHHCCAVNNPDKQDPTEWKRFEALQERVHRECELSSQLPDYIPTSEIPATISYNHGKRSHRQKRMSGVQPNNLKAVNLYTATFSSSGDINNSGERVDFHDILSGNMEEDAEITEGHFGEIPEPKLSANNNDAGGFGKILPSGDSGVEDDLGGIFHNDTPITVDGTINHYIVCGELTRDFRKIQCTPKPDAFNPCEDVMGYSWLRIIVWFVLLAAVVGNVLVIVVNITGRTKLTVPKFLMCNLAFSDFLMGIYLLLIASIDARTLGKYFNFAVSWQHEGGCQAAGFLTVFSSELSVYTLTIVTLERWYAISHAIHLTKRLRLKQAIFAMGGGWIVASLVAFLPLVGVSGYGRVSICLPMVVNSTVDLIYIVSILVLNGVAFVIIFISYISMYWKVRSSEVAAGSNDATIAKRMAMLVVTNFVCWAPIAFFGLTAAAGAPLIDITKSKILLVFFYPLNSCADPFLYVILTKQFRRDFILLMDKCGLCTERAYTYKAAMDWSKYWTRSHNNSSARLHINNDSSYSLAMYRPNRSSLNKNYFECTTSSTTAGSDFKCASRTSSDVSHIVRRSDHNNKSDMFRISESKPHGRAKSCPSRYNVRETMGREVRSVSEYVILYPYPSRQSGGNISDTDSPTERRGNNSKHSSLEDMCSTSLIQTLSLDLSIGTTDQKMFSELSTYGDKTRNSSLKGRNSDYLHKNVMKRTDPAKRNQFHIPNNLYSESDQCNFSQTLTAGSSDFCESTDDERSPCLRRK